MKVFTRFSCLILMILLGLSPQLARAEGNKYYVPPSSLNAAMKVADQGLSNLFVLFRSSTASFSFDADAKTLDNLKVAIDANSLMMAQGGNQMEFQMLLDAIAYPEISFIQTEPATFTDDKNVDVKGMLTIHRVTKPFTLTTKLNQVGSADKVGLSMNGTIKRADFNMGDNPQMRGRFGGEFTLILEMQALKQ